MRRTNIMLKDEQLRRMKLYAKREGTTLGKLVRDAIDTVYGKKDPVEERRKVALSAYEEGFISLGKLAEVLGLDPVSTRHYLKERGLRVHFQDDKELAKDAENA